MNDKKAKLLRKTVYGNLDFRYREYDTSLNGQVTNKESSLRSVYQKTKKLYNERNRNVCFGYGS